jgi:hypothetical protein
MAGAHLFLLGYHRVNSTSFYRPASVLSPQRVGQTAPLHNLGLKDIPIPSVPSVLSYATDRISLCSISDTSGGVAVLLRTTA